MQLLSRHFIKMDPTQLQTDADFISYPSMCSDLDKSPAYRMKGLKAHVVHLYPRWVSSREMAH